MNERPECPEETLEAVTEVIKKFEWAKNPIRTHYNDGFNHGLDVAISLIRDALLT